MNAQQIMAMKAGPQLDRAVHEAVGATGKPPAYSSDMEHATTLLVRYSLFCAAIDRASAEYNAERPFVAGTLAFRPDIRGEVTVLRVVAPTPELAICKAALVVATRPIRAAPKAAPSIADKIGKSTKNKTAQPKRPDPVRRPFRQPISRTHAHDARPPIPKRTAKFVGPQPIAAAGADRKL